MEILDRLAGANKRIHILQIDINRWHNSSLSVVQYIEDDMIKKQPFQQIIIYYPCIIRNTMERIVLVKDLQIQAKSTCPEQVKIIPEDENTIHDNSIHDPIYTQNNTHFDYYDYDRKKKRNRFNSSVKVCLLKVFFYK